MGRTRKEEGENKQEGRFGIEGISQEKQLPAAGLSQPKLQVAVLLFRGASDLLFSISHSLEVVLLLTGAKGLLFSVSHTLEVVRTERTGG